MDVFLAIVVLVALALVATSKPFYRLRRSAVWTLLVAGGWPAVAAGIALGPAFGGILSDQALLRSSPVMAIGLGFIGLMIGFQMQIPVLRAVPAPARRVVALDALLTITVFGAVSAIGLWLWSREAVPGWAALLTPLALLVAACAGWSMETRSLRSATGSDNAEGAMTIRLTGALAAIGAVLGFGVVAKLTARGVDGVVQADPGGFIVGLATAIGGALVVGLLGRFAIGRASPSRAELLAVFLGLIAFVAGTAAEMGHSPLFASLLTGAVLANLRASETARLHRFVAEWEHVLAVMVFLLAGVLMDPNPGAVALGLAVVIAFLRVGLKPLALRAAGPSLGPLRIGAARQSPVATALALGVVLLEPSEFNRELLTVVVISGVLSDLLTLGAARWLRGPAPEGDPFAPAEVSP